MRSLLLHAIVGAMRWWVLSGFLLAAAFPAAVQTPNPVEVRKIWDQAPHNAFTDLARFQGRWYCVFREGTAHVSPDGALRVIASADGDRWESVALFRSATADLRDAKFSVTPDGVLMLNAGAALHPPAPARHRSLAWFSSDGTSWAGPVEIGEPDVWIWRVVWHKRKAYGLGYSTAEEKFTRLYISRDGRKYGTWVERLFEADYPNEASMLFLGDGTALCLLRRDGAAATAQLGFARPPYRHWRWKNLAVRIGGPHLLRLPGGRIVAAVRLYGGEPIGQARTSLCWVDPAAGTLTEFLALPSGGDTSYAGLVFHDSLLWVSYYSSHEHKASIYLARIKFPLTSASYIIASRHQEKDATCRSARKPLAPALRFLHLDLYPLIRAS